MRATILTILLLAAPLAGCLEPFNKANNDTMPAAAAERGLTRLGVLDGSVGGEKVESKTVKVPAGSSRFVVSAKFSVAGEGNFKLYDPAGRVVKSDGASGSASVNNDEWYAVDDPRAGTWQLKVDVSGSASYHFEFFG